MSSWTDHCKKYAKEHNCSYKQAMTEARESYEKTGGSLKSYIHNVKYRSNFNSTATKTISKYGNNIITNITAKRTPVSSLLTKALDVVSLGKFGERMDKTFDKLFHLFLEVKLDNGVSISLEKQEQVNIRVADKKKRQGEEDNVIYSVPEGLTLATLVDNTKKRMGNKFFDYASNSNNCQDFLINILDANGIGDAQDRAWIKQDVDQLFKGLNKVKQIANAVTDLGNQVASIADIGEIKNRKKYIPQKETYQQDTNPNATLDTSTEMEGAGIKSTQNKWILHVKAYAKKHNISYWKAIKEARPSYKK